MLEWTAELVTNWGRGLLDSRYHPFIIRQDKDLVGELHHGGWKSGAGTFLQAIALCKSWKHYNPTHLGFEMPSHGREDENRKNENRLWWSLNIKQLRKKWTTLNFLVSHRMINLNYKDKNERKWHFPRTWICSLKISYLLKELINFHVIDLWLKFILFIEWLNIHETVVIL